MKKREEYAEEQQDANMQPTKNRYDFELIFEPFIYLKVQISILLYKYFNILFTERKEGK